MTLYGDGGFALGLVCWHYWLLWYNTGSIDLMHPRWILLDLYLPKAFRLRIFKHTTEEHWPEEESIIIPGPWNLEMGKNSTLCLITWRIRRVSVRLLSCGLSRRTNRSSTDSEKFCGFFSASELCGSEWFNLNLSEPHNLGAGKSLQNCSPLVLLQSVASRSILLFKP